MNIDDELLEKLGNAFVYHNYYNRYGLTFEHFVFKYQRGDYHNKKLEMRNGQ